MCTCILVHVHVYCVYTVYCYSFIPHPHKSRILDSLPSGSGNYCQQLPLPDGVPSDAPYLVLPRTTPTCNIEMMLPLISVYYMYLPIPLSLSLSLSLSPLSPIMTHSSHFPSRNSLYTGVVVSLKWTFHFSILRIHN